MTERRWEVGDVVQLNSGGPIMTVDEVDDERGMVSCVWIENGQLCCAEALNPNSLHTEPVEALVGDYFLSLKKDETIEWQGQVLASIPDSDLYEVELLSWIHGQPVERRIVSIDQMEEWFFYGDIEQLQAAYLALKKQTVTS